MTYIKKRIKIILVCILTILIGIVLYYLYIPEFKKSNSVDEIYVYVYDGKFLNKRYIAKLKKEIQIDVSNSKFSIILPYNHTIVYKWNLTNNKTIKPNKIFIKKCRTPIYDRDKDGVDYSMQVFEFQRGKSTSEKFVFKYSSTVCKDEKNSRQLIINVNYN